MPWFWRGRLQGGGVLNDMMCHSALVVRHLLTKPGQALSTVKPVRVTGHIASLKWSQPAYAKRLKNIRVAGKTGTARKPAVGRRGYIDGAYVSSFAGFVPSERPALTAMVILDEPTPIYGGVVAAPVFARIAQYGLREFKIAPPPAGQTTHNTPKLSESAVANNREANAAKQNFTPPRNSASSTTVSTSVVQKESP